MVAVFQRPTRNTIEYEGNIRFLHGVTQLQKAATDVVAFFIARM